MTFLKSVGTAFIAAVAASLICSPAYATFEFSFDENGTGCLLNSDHICTTPVVGVLAPDPTNGGSGDVLTYLLPELVITGDVGVGDFGTGLLSDLMAFTNANGDLSGAQDGDRMIFYSELGGSDLADTGFPDRAFSIIVTENANGTFDWFPGGNVYHGTSPENVPEPVTLSLFGAGLVGATAIRRRKRKSA